MMRNVTTYNILLSNIDGEKAFVQWNIHFLQKIARLLLCMNMNQI